MSVAVIVIAYNRPDALRRLLGSLVRASYQEFDSVPLLISIDGEGPPEVVAVAREFQWPFGEKTVIAHTKRLGLKEHVLNCGDRVVDYDGIIMLEDDLLVSPLFYRYGVGALDYYKEDSNVGGISLYSYRQVYGIRFFSSVAYGDSFLMRFPSSWGQAWTSLQWQRFRSWLKRTSENGRCEHDAWLPQFVTAWSSSSSWKKEFARYLVDTNAYIVYPNVALTTNMGDSGYHFKQNSLAYQVPLRVAPAAFRFTSYSQMVSYDQFFELESRSLDLLGVSHNLASDVEFDLYGQKPFPLISDKPVVSSKRPRSDLPSYGKQLIPHELNIVYDIKGRQFYLGEGADFRGAARPSRLDLLEHQTAFLGVRDRAELLYRSLKAKVRERL